MQLFNDVLGWLNWKVSSTGQAEIITKNRDFKPSSYDGDITMDGTAKVITLATDVKLGGGSVSVYNRGATTEAIRIAFGTSAANAEANLSIAAAAAVTGYYIPAFADGGTLSRETFGVPLLATHLAICNAVAADVQTVSVTQGV